MGLVQVELEKAGFTTITLSTIGDFTASVGAPRVTAIEFPPGRPFGQPDDDAQQMEILRATLDSLVSAKTPGEIQALPFRWHEERPRWHPKKSTPIAKLIRRKPWLYVAFLAGDIPSPSKTNVESRS